MPRRSVATRREGGLVLSMSELRLGKPSDSVADLVPPSVTRISTEESPQAAPHKKRRL